MSGTKCLKQMQAMILFPNVQKTAQSEIDTVVGNHRLPTWDDSEQLPYIMACVKEAARCHLPQYVLKSPSRTD